MKIILTFVLALLAVPAYGGVTTLDRDGSGNVTVPSTVAATADMANALSADPADCGANQFAQSIVAAGTLTCAAIADADVPDTITITLATTNETQLAVVAVDTTALNTQLDVVAADTTTHAGVTGSAAHGAVSANTVSQIVTRDGSGNFAAGTITAALTGNADTATTATNLASDPSDCAANEFADAIDAEGDLTCNAIVDADVPDSITIALAATATALAADGDDCPAGQAARGVDASGAAELCFTPAGAGDLLAAGDETITGDWVFGASVTFVGAVNFSIRTSSMGRVGKQTFTNNTFTGCKIANGTRTITLTDISDIKFEIFGSWESSGAGASSAIWILLDGDFIPGVFNISTVNMRKEHGAAGAPEDIAFVAYADDVAVGTHDACIAMKTNTGTVTLEDTTSEADVRFRISRVLQ